MHHCKRYRSPEQDSYLSHRWKRRRSYSREHEGRLRYPSRREPLPPRRSRSRSHDRLPYQRRYRERRDSDNYRFEERSPSFGEDYYSARSHHRRRSRERDQHRTRKHPHHCRKRRTRSCSSASSMRSWEASGKAPLARWWSAWTMPGERAGRAGPWGWPRGGAHRRAID
uniref:CDC like kinase 3 n=1 Tax=Sarcophilus harrisii TaxID=9305 RepID=A0A7N4V1M1_SARHA